MVSTRFFSCIALALVASYFFACQPDGSGPNDEMIKQDLTAIATSTKFGRQPHGLFGMPSLARDTSFTLDQFEVAGRARDSSTVRVRTIATVLFNATAPVQCNNLWDGAGLGVWLTFADTCKPGEKYRFNITLLYRHYDTGWKLESYDR